MAIDWQSCFETYGIKTVTSTDKGKSAYVLNKEQLAAVAAAGITPSPNRPADPFTVTLFLDEGKTVLASFYFSEREGAGRTPEARIGREFITDWLNAGDRVVIGNIGKQLFAAKVTQELSNELQVAEAIAKRSDTDTRKKLIAKAKAVAGKPTKKVVSRNDYARNPAIVMGAIARANGKCETPGCNAELFQRDDDSTYLEVHHVTPLAEDGDDTLLNAAALCPKCHRELHFGKARMKLRTALSAHILSIT